MKSSPLLRFWRDKAGASSIEYALIAAGISTTLVLALNVLASNRNVDCSSSPSSNVSTRQFDKLNLEPSNDRQGK
ncbi:Flp family type IVb pilin [Bradyrhizobium sp. WSM 1744]|uniref:Flp family type IVb pilin n=1 Tax=Bradyrhizobium archetypum TaxID=2721160 RepID=A0A7Y4H9G0_9BRAD|nr:Flp family type IVb pilin [Bradyrhizobium archetypum]NOJ50110.1 Flp family type IVb pilin [Bradyrhizobium archetypum]